MPTLQNFLDLFGLLSYANRYSDSPVSAVSISAVPDLVRFTFLDLGQ